MIITEEKIQKMIDKKIRFKFPYTAKDYAKNLYLENYHCHKDFSNVRVPDSPQPIQDYADRVKELNVKCLYSGEHGTQGNQFEVYKCAEENELKYRHSAEVYWVKDRKIPDGKNCHMIIVAKNPEGRKDLNYIISMANIDGFYRQPRIDLELLLSVPKDNFIVTSACIAGWKYEDSDEIWLKIAEHFKENFYLEVQNHNTEPQKKLNKHIVELSRKHHIPLICGLDSHYINDIGRVKRDQILKYKKVVYPEEEGWYMDYPDTKEVIRRFEEQGVLNEVQILEAIMNTNVFVNECEEIILNRHFKIPSLYPNMTKSEKEKIYKRKLNIAYKKESVKSEEKKEGIRWEAQQVIDSDTVDYFLTSSAIVKKGVEDFGGVLTTTSRGSAASFVTNKLLGLTTVDRYTSEIPIYPERFLTKERVLAGQMPDIDLNISAQEPFVSAARELMGKESCYPLMAVEKLKEKAAWQLYAGANDVSPQDANQISKYLDAYNKDLKYAEEEDKEFIHVEDYIPKEYLELYRKSLEYQNITINLKVHACGHLIFDGDIRREIGLITAQSETTGKRTLCAAVEGKYLDEFGYVKEDFLMVDSVTLTHKFFTSIGRQVPSFEELKHMVAQDNKTWEIYAKGMTCCVNQCEKDKTTEKVKKYKPKNIRELSSFIAGIRPGFMSLINVFLNREEYSTGEKSIDELLQGSSHFMLYQESIMKVLSFLGLPMGDTYGVIKSISKKKLKGKKKEDLQNRLKDSWMDKFGNLDNFKNVWDVINQSAAYAFNAPHAYSMAGDSLYQAWFKAHYPVKFYEVAITHYQDKGNKKKINALVDEAREYYGYQMGAFRFGDDNRRVHINEQNKIIYPNLSSVKGFGEKVSDILYELGMNKYENFIDVMTAILSHSITKPCLEKLIKIDYFSNYGKAKKLLKMFHLYNNFYGKKQFNKESILKNGYDIEVLRLFGKETEKQIREIDSQGLLSYYINLIPDEDFTIKEQIQNQLEVFEHVSLIDRDVPGHMYVVNEIFGKGKKKKVTLYHVKDGETKIYYCWASNIDREPFDEKDIIYVYKEKQENKKRPSDKINPKTGKAIWEPIPNEYEDWLISWTTERDM